MKNFTRKWSERGTPGETRHRPRVGHVVFLAPQKRLAYPSTKRPRFPLASPQNVLREIE